MGARLGGGSGAHTATFGLRLNRDLQLRLLTLCPMPVVHESPRQLQTCWYDMTALDETFALHMGELVQSAAELAEAWQKKLAASNSEALQKAEDVASSHAAALEAHKVELEQKNSELADAHAKLQEYEAVAAANREAMQQHSGWHTALISAGEKNHTEETQTDLSIPVGTCLVAATTAQEALAVATWWAGCAHEKNQQAEKTPDLVAGMQQLGVNLDVPTYNAPHSACEKGNKAEKTTELQDEMQTTGSEPNGSTDEKGNSGAQTPEQTPELLTDTQPLISACETRIVDAHISACNSELLIVLQPIISACEKVSKGDEAIELFADELKQRGMAPMSACDVDQAETLALDDISACEKGEKDMKLRAEIQQSETMEVDTLDLAPDGISACEEKAFELVAVLQQRGSEPNANTCTSLVSHTRKGRKGKKGKGKKEGKTLEPLAETQQDGETPEVFTPNALSSACEVCHKDECVVAQLDERNKSASSTATIVVDDEMQQRGLEHNAQDRACEKSEAEKDAKLSAEIQSETMEVDTLELAPDVISACEVKDIELVAGLQQRGLMPIANTCTSLVSETRKGKSKGKKGKGKDFEKTSLCHERRGRDIIDFQEVKTFELLAEPQQEQHRPSWADIGTGAVTLNAPREVKRLEAENAAHRERIALLYTTDISACLKGHEVGKAMELVAEMQQGGWIPNLATHITLISACVSCDQEDKATELLAEMRQRGFTPDE